MPARRLASWLARRPLRQPARGFVFSSLLLGAACGVGGETDPTASSLSALTPSGFNDTVIASLGSPTGLAFTPDGRILVTTQGGRLRIVQNGSLVATPALDLSATACTQSERGLLGVAVDPSFAQNQYIYLYYTAQASGSCVNRVSRFVLSGNSVSPSSQTVLLDNIPSTAGNHNAGDVQFGKDGYLYVSVGDGGCSYANPNQCSASNTATRDLNAFSGKILRITKDGQAPSSNPYMGSDSDVCRLTGKTSSGRRCREIFAYGLRNPFRMAFDPNAASTRFYINDVGQNTWEEINLGTAGADYGWNTREGSCTIGSYTNCGSVGSFTNPIYSYSHNGPCGGITGGAFVPSGVWPSPYGGSYLFSDYTCGKIFRLVPNGSSFTATEFATSLGSSSAVALAFGPYGSTQALYYTTYANGGQLRRISYGGSANSPPVAVASANPTAGNVPLAVSFDGTGSTDPEGNALTYAWTFGDGTTGSGATTSHSYTTPGTFTATLKVTDSAGAQSSASSVTIHAGSNPPQATITAPTTSDRFYVGQVVTLQANATDQEDGALPNSALAWTVLKHHGNHTHPFVPRTSGNGITFTAPAPEDLAATTNSYLEIQLEATDSSGTTTTVTQNLLPRLVDVTLASSPSGLSLQANEVVVTTPSTLTSWQGFDLALRAQDQGSYEFSAWSDGVTSSERTVTTPSTATTYRADFDEVPASGPGEGNGLVGEYFYYSDLTTLQRTRLDSTIDFDWGAGSPDPAIHPETFSVRWTGKIVPLYSEAYTLYAQSDEGMRLWINGQLLIDDWTSHALRERSATVAFTAGTAYDIRVEYKEMYGAATARLLWSSFSQPKQVVPESQLFASTTGVYGEYYNNGDFTSLLFTRVDPTLSFNWASSSPDQSQWMNGDTFSVRWRAQVVAPTSGNYTFYTQSDEGVRLWVGGTLLIDNWTPHSSIENSGTIALTAGEAYDVRVDYFEGSHAALCELRWSGPSIAKQIIPSAQLIPVFPAH